MNIITEQRSNIRRFGKIALLGIIFGAALALMFALTALAEDQSASTETTAPESNPVVEETTPPVEEPVVDETTPSEEPLVDETAASEEQPVVEETTVPDTEPVVEETTASGEEPVIDETAALEEEPVEDELQLDDEGCNEEEDPLVPTFSEEIAEDQSDVATIESDKSSYVPGDVVVITGEGWLPSETVSLTFNEDPLQHDPYVFYSVADDNGNILNSDFIVEDHDVGTAFTVYALGQISNLYAQTTFTDARYFTVSITPTSTTYGASVNYTITITNTSGNASEKMGSVVISIPSGMNNPTSMTVSDSGWSAPIIDSGKIKTAATGGGESNKVSIGGTVVIIFTATSTSVGSQEWTTYAYGGKNYSTDPHTIQGSQPTVTVNKATPVITWSNPADIVYGTALSGAQLNASTSPSVAGSFVYAPAAGVVLGAGNNQKLSTTFTPTDIANYNNALADVYINVNKAPLTITADDKTKIYGDVLPVFTASYSGFVLGEDESILDGKLTFTTPADQSSLVGSYAITPGGLTSDNYDITFVDGTLTITPAPVAIAPATTTPIVIAGITEVAGVKKAAGALKVAGITELPFTGSNIVLSYIIAILMIMSGTAIILSSRKMKVDKAKN